LKSNHRTDNKKEEEGKAREMNRRELTKVK
jgi:hypothetical protein